jgi:hypothetical protein
MPASKRFGKGPRDNYLLNDWSGTSASQLPVVPVTAFRIGQRFIRLAGALEFNRRGAGANIRVVPPRQRAESTPDGFVVSILRDTQHNVVVHRAFSCEPLLVLIQSALRQPIRNEPGDTRTGYRRGRRFGGNIMSGSASTPVHAGTS